MATPHNGQRMTDGTDRDLLAEFYENDDGEICIKVSIPHDPNLQLDELADETWKARFPTQFSQYEANRDAIEASRVAEAERVIARSKSRTKKNEAAP